MPPPTPTRRRWLKELHDEGTMCSECWLLPPYFCAPSDYVVVTLSACFFFVFFFFCVGRTSEVTYHPRGSVLAKRNVYDASFEGGRDAGVRVVVCALAFILFRSWRHGERSRRLMRTYARSPSPRLLVLPLRELH